MKEFNLDFEALMLMSETLDKMDIKKVEGKNYEQIGNNIYLQLIKKAHIAREEIKSLIKHITGVEASTLKLKDMKELFEEIKESDDVKNFFTKQ